MLAWELRNDSILTVTGSLNDLNSALDLGNSDGAAVYLGKAGVYGSEQFSLNVQQGPESNSGILTTQTYTFNEAYLDIAFALTEINHMLLSKTAVFTIFAAFTEFFEKTMSVREHLPWVASSYLFSLLIQHVQR